MKIKKQIKNAYQKVLSFIPQRLPVGLTEFDAWADSIIELAGRFADNNSLKYVLSDIIMRLKPTQDKVSKHYFVKSLRKAAANQIAAQQMYQIKMQQKEAADAEKARLEAKATETEVNTVVSSRVDAE